MMRQHWWLHTTAVVGAVVMFMLVAAWMAQPWWEYAFLSDDSAVSWLSSALLLANAAVALNLTLNAALPPALGAALSLGLAFLAADEQFLLHERLTLFLPLGMGNAPTLVVGGCGLAMLILLNRALTTPAARYLLIVGVAIGLFALWVDLGAPPPRVARLEEAFEVLAEALFLSGLLEISRAQVQSAS